MHTLNSPLWGSDLGVGVDLRIRLPSSTMSAIQRLQLGSLKGLGGWGILSYLYAHTHTTIMELRPQGRNKKGWPFAT